MGNSTDELPVRGQHIVRRLIAIVTAVIAVVAALDTWTRWQKAADEEREHARMVAERDDYELLKTEVEELGIMIARMNALQSDPEQSAIASERLYKALVDRVESLETSTEALRSAIDPTTEEALTVARLKDRINALEEQRGELEQHFSEQLDRFERSIQLQIEASQTSVRWLFVLLVPLILNLWYTGRKDWRDSRKSEESRT